MIEKTIIIQIYQKISKTSQFDLPIAEHGYVDIEVEGKTKRIRITRIHMEEDAGNSFTLVLQSKILVALMLTIIVLVYHLLKSYLNQICILQQKLVHIWKKNKNLFLQYIDVSNCKMEEGNLRADVNVSLRPEGSEKLGTKVEMKNLNSFKVIEDALEYEIERQNEVLEDGGILVQETRTWDDGRGITLSMRSKEKSSRLSLYART